MTPRTLPTDPLTRRRPWAVAAALLASAWLAGCGESGSDAAGAGTQAGGVAEVGEKALDPTVVGRSRWSTLKTLPMVPVSASNLPDGKVLLWSADEKFSFGAPTGRTYSLVFDPAADTVTERTVSETDHNMFCPGTTNLADGRLLVNGGISTTKTSLYDPATGQWSAGATMNIPRGYQANTLLQDGSVLTLGGSWSGGTGGKHGEIWTAAQGWRRLTGVPIDSFLSPDPSRSFGMDSHFWLIPAPNGKVFHAGPGRAMHWIDTTGAGRVIPAGLRGDDEFSISGTTVMYDTGKILKAGGAPQYDSANANANTFVIDVNAGLTVRRIASMAYRRAFHNSVVLPNGQVLILGGQTYAVGFSDNNSVLVPEIFDPISETFTTLPAMAAPRNYHSVALLLPDARVLSAGGGLCGAGCTGNHPDLQVLSPYYLFNADGTPATRPVITAAPGSARLGRAIQVSTNSAVTAFSMVRMSSTTHTVNNDQRRLPLNFAAVSGTTYNVSIPSNPGLALPGDWMLFAIDAKGTPSVAKIVRISLDGAASIQPIDDQTAVTGGSVALQPTVTLPQGSSAAYSATGLPPGLTIDAATGRIQGMPNLPGTYPVSLSVATANATSSTSFVWSVADPGVTRYVKLEALSEVNGNPWASAAEINLFDSTGRTLSRGAWQITADSQELSGENGAAANALDGLPGTIWHTQWTGGNPPMPHQVVINLGAEFKLGGMRYLPRQDGSPNGTIGRYRISLSADGVNWGTPVASGDFGEIGTGATERTVYFQNLALNRTAQQSSTFAVGAEASKAVDGNVNGAYGSGSVTHTTNESNPWWEVDLAQSYALQAVRVWNRTDCCGERLANFYLFVSETPMTGRTLAQLLADPSVWRSQQQGAVTRSALLAASGARGRYVRIQLNGANFLHLAEVEVHGAVADNRPPTVTTPAPMTTEQGQAARLALSAVDPDGDIVSYSVTGLPPGIGVNAATGVVAGTPTTAGVYDVAVTVSDGRGGSASTRFAWTVLGPPPVLAPVSAPAIVAGGSASYTANPGTTGNFTYQWTFGDGSPATAWSSSPTASHVYAAGGVYFVTVTVRTEDGRTSARSFWQSVQGTTGRAGRSSSPIAVESRAGANARVWVVNPDNDTVSVIDAVTRARVAEIPVGRQPRSLAVSANGRVWVVNKASATISVITTSNLAVAQTVALPTGSQPYGVVLAADGSAWVASEGTGRVTRVSAAGVPGASVDVGTNVRHLALSADETRLLVSRFITPPQPGEGTATVSSTLNGVAKGGELLWLDAASLSVQRTIVLEHSTKSDTTAQGRGVPNYLGAPVIAPDGVSAWVPSKQDNVKRGTLRDGQHLDFQNTVRAISSRVNLATLTEDVAARVDHDNSGVASAAVFHPGGNYLFVALEASRHVAVIDAIGKRELFRVDAGRAPQGLAVSPDGSTLYVQNFMDRTVGVYDLSRLTQFGESVLTPITSVGSVASERLSATVLKGKQFFYDARDPRLSRDAYLSCASCHQDGGHDGRTWDFTGFGEGLRNTVSLRGRAGAQGRLHWSANFDEVQDFEGQIRGFAQGTGLMTDAQFNAGTRRDPLGDRKAGVSADLDALAAYVASLSAQDPSPWRAADGALTADGVAGKAVFAAKCASCHGGADYTDSAAGVLRNVGTLKTTSGNRLGAALTGIDTPTLRDAWATAPYLHDGSAARIEEAVAAHTVFVLSPTELASVSAFVRQIGSQEGPVTPATDTGAGTGLKGEYFNNLTLSGTPALTRTEAIDFTWGFDPPGGTLGGDNYSVRWTGELLAPSTGAYRFETFSDDGVRVWVNGVLVIDNWTDHAPTWDSSAPVNLVGGQRYVIKVEYYERSSWAVMSLRWATPGTTTAVPIPASLLYPPNAAVTPPGLLGEYFGNLDLAGTPVVTRREAVDFFWTESAPAAGLPENGFSVRWTGNVTAPVTGSYRFQTQSDDGVRLWVGGTLVIDNWTDHANTTDTSVALTLTAGQRYPIRLEFYDRWSWATIKLLWIAPGATQGVIVPLNALSGP